VVPTGEGPSGQLVRTPGARPVGLRHVLSGIHLGVFQPVREGTRGGTRQGARIFSVRLYSDIGIQRTRVYVIY
jgi:hypothetical protein